MIAAFPTAKERVPDVEYRDVETDGAARAAERLAQLL